MRKRLVVVGGIGAAVVAGFIWHSGAGGPYRGTAFDPAAKWAGDSLAVGESDDEIAGELAVDLRDDLDAPAIAAVAKEYGLALHPNSPISDGYDNLEVADVDPQDEAELLEKLGRDPRVEHAEPMALYRATFVPNDPLYAEKQWHLKRVGAETAWDYTCGRGVTVAVIDTGVACYDSGGFSKGTDLQGTRCSGGYNFVHDSEEAFDDQGHGTHVAGTIAQTTNNGKGVAGLAYCATLMPVKVLTKQGWGTLADVAEGIRFAADHGAQIINLSLGGPSPAGILKDSVEHAISKGVLVVAAAGNSGRRVGYPAAYPGVLAVSATDANDGLAWFSSRGPEVGISAPGVGVTQQTICDGGHNQCEIFGTWNGTSMATPHVAGAAAMVMATGVTDVSAVRTALTDSARAKGDPSQFGAGILDVGAAVRDSTLFHLVLRLGALFGLLALVYTRIRSQRGAFTKSPLAVVGALTAGTGLLAFAPFTGLLTRVGAARLPLELLARPFGEWDLSLVGPAAHAWLPLACALPTMIGAVFLLGIKPLRPLVGGFGLGAAALLAQVAITADVHFPLGSFLLRLFAVVNALVCLWVARIALDSKKA